MAELSDGERIAQLERELIELRAKQGSLPLSTGTLTLLWAVFLAAISAIVFVVALAAKVESNQASMKESREAIIRHLASPGHEVALERTEDLRRRIEKLESSQGGAR